MESYCLDRWLNCTYVSLRDHISVHLTTPVPLWWLKQVLRFGPTFLTYPPFLI